jgi:hypothetical protein
MTRWESLPVWSTFYLQHFCKRFHPRTESIHAFNFYLLEIAPSDVLALNIKRSYSSNQFIFQDVALSGLFAM